MTVRDDRANVRLDVFGHVLRLACDPSDLVALEAQWRRCLIRGEPPNGASVHDVLEPREGGRTAYLYAVQMRVTMAAIAAATGELLMWHAAGLSTPDGRVLGLVASSGTGKTTATAHLATHGWGYVTDETLACTPDGHVWPYPKPLAFRSAGDNKSSVAPDALGLGMPPAHLRLHRLVVLARHTDLSRAPALSRLGLVAGLLALIEQSSGLLGLDRPLQRLCHVVDLVGGVWQLDYVDIAAAHAVLSEFMDGGGSAAGGNHDWHAEPVDDPNRRGPIDPAGRVVWRAPYRDAVAVGADGSELVILVGSVPAQVAGIGTVIWRAAGAGILEEDLPALVEAQFGPHPQAEALVGAAVDELIQASVLVRGQARARDRSP